MARRTGLQQELQKGTVRATALVTFPVAVMVSGIELVISGKRSAKKILRQQVKVVKTGRLLSRSDLLR